MYTKKLSVIACFVALSLLTIFFFVASQSAGRQKSQKERELQLLRAELSGKDAEIAEVKRQQEDSLKSLRDKVAELEATAGSLQSTNESLEASLKSQEETVRALTEKNEALLKDREALMEDNLEKSQNVTDLEKKVAELEAGKRELAQRLQAIESKKSEESRAPKPPVRSAYELRYDTAPPVNKAKLGKVLVQKSSGRSAQVQHVNEVYRFVILNAGSREGLRNGSVVNIIRGEEIIAKAVVEKLKQDLSAAVLLPEWSREPVQVGDFITQF